MYTLYLQHQFTCRCTWYFSLVIFTRGNSKIFRTKLLFTIPVKLFTKALPQVFFFFFFLSLSATLIYLTILWYRSNYPVAHIHRPTLVTFCTLSSGFLSISIPVPIRCRAHPQSLPGYSHFPRLYTLERSCFSTSQVGGSAGLLMKGVFPVASAVLAV